MKNIYIIAGLILVVVAALYLFVIRDSFVEDKNSVRSRFVDYFIAITQFGEGLKPSGKY